jgi:hypothetical protein
MAGDSRLEARVERGDDATTTRFGVRSVDNDLRLVLRRVRSAQRGARVGHATTAIGLNRAALRISAPALVIAYKPRTESCEMISCFTSHRSLRFAVRELLSELRCLVTHPGAAACGHTIAPILAPLSGPCLSRTSRTWKPGSLAEITLRVRGGSRRDIPGTLRGRCQGLRAAPRRARRP